MPCCRNKKQKEAGAAAASSEFVGKSVIVTGSSSGIGESVALLYASRGANVMVCGRDQARMQEVVNKCRKAANAAGHKNKFLAVAGEMTNATVRSETVKRTVNGFGGLDILVVNHGAGVQTPDLASITEDIFTSQFDVNVKSVLFLVKEAVPHLEKSKGNIVVTSSVGSFMPSNVGAQYYVSKHAVDHMVRCLALELGPKGIRVNATNPTLVLTRFMRNEDASNPLMADMMKYACQAHPLEGRASVPDEQAEVILFLSSEGAGFITGETVKVDGAISLKGNPQSFFLQTLQQK